MAVENEFGFQPHVVQLIGAIGLFRGNVVEMQTGEGKTVTAVFPAVLRALAGRGTHVVTANDYLAARDAEKMGTVYHALGLSVGHVIDGMPDDDRRVSYRADITYGTASQFGFDFLHDRRRAGVGSMADRWRLPTAQSANEELVQRGHYAAIIDEADSVLIDDAMTPLLIGIAKENSAAEIALWEWAQSLSSDLIPEEEVIFDAKKRSATLTEAGCRRVLIASKPASLDGMHAEEIYTAIESAVCAAVAYQRGRDYVIADGEIVIIDESTGRKLDGRKWQRGLHQAVETKESVVLSDQTTSAAQITVQSYFRLYSYLCGMTGTARTAAREFRRVYAMNVVRIPTNQQCLRRELPTRVFPTQEDKWLAVIEEIETLVSVGRAVLVGTPSVAESEALSQLLSERSIKHAVLNATQDSEEAEIVSQAGRAGRVTIATNMAGRGTDIIIDEDVIAAGGLHVIATAKHSSTRIDRQLSGRSARQGQPGSHRLYLSMTDELLRHAGLTLSSHSTTNERLFRKAQARLESHGRRQRKQLLESEKKRLESFDGAGLDPYLEIESDD